MKKLTLSVCAGLLIASLSYLTPLHADNHIAQQYVPQPGGQTYQAQPNPYYQGSEGTYYYNQNNPYANSNAPQLYNNGFYGGFYGSPPPPTPAQAFPDKAASDALYRYIQSR